MGDNMNKEKTKEYLKGLNFGLKDYNKTFNKYKNYKENEFLDFIDYNKKEIDNYFNFEIITEINQKIEKHISMVKYDLNQKRFIRYFKTLINSLTYQNNLRFIEYLLRLHTNKNTINNFTIKFYLKYYGLINSIMKDILTSYVLEYPKRAIVKKLSVVV
jgi:hypothetical protein